MFNFVSIKVFKISEIKSKLLFLFYCLFNLGIILFDVVHSYKKYGKLRSDSSNI